MEKILPSSTSSDDLPETLFRQYYARFCYFAFQFVKDEKVAEDIVQDAFIAFWKNRRLVADHPVAIKNFFYSSIRHACYNVLRRGKVTARFHQQYQPDLIEEPLYLEQIIRAEVLAEIYKAMAALPEACCKVFRLGYLEGLSNPEIAQTLGISVNTVKTQKRRALVVLRAKLRPEMYSFLLTISILA